MSEDLIGKLLQGDEISVEVPEGDMEAYIYIPAGRLKNLTEKRIRDILEKEKIT